LLNLSLGCPFAPRCPFAFDRCQAEIPPLVEVTPGRRAACHLYPDHAELPPLPERAILVADDPPASAAAGEHHP
jgi:hypothetical protein